VHPDLVGTACIKYAVNIGRFAIVFGDGDMGNSRLSVAGINDPFAAIMAVATNFFIDGLVFFDRSPNNRLIPAI